MVRTDTGRDVVLLDFSRASGDEEKENGRNKKSATFVDKTHADRVSEAQITRSVHFYVRKESSC